MNAISTNALRKSYGDREVLHGIDLAVPRGAVFGFLGPNGAGKTTAIRIVMGLLKPTAGSVDVLGREPWHQGAALRRHIGYLPGDIVLYPQMTGRAVLAFLDGARGGGASAEIDRLATRLQIDLSVKVRECSRGMKQKIGVIQALMHRPELLVLDEPSTGLDPLMQEVLRDELREAAGRGQTILFSSHSLREVQQLCDRVAILREGRLIEQARISSLRERALRRVELQVRDGAVPQRFPEEFQRGTVDGRRVSGVWVGSTPRLIEWLAEVMPDDVTLAPPDLDDLFMTYYDEPDARP